MQITLKNIKYSAFASHDSHCFEATVYVDGQRAFGVANDGNGGPNHYFPLNKKRTGTDVYDWVQRIDRELGKQIVQCDGFEIANSLDIEVGERVNEWLLRQEAIKTLRHVVYRRNGKFYRLASRLKPTPETLARVKEASWWSDEYLLLNELPREEAIAILCAAMK